MLRTFDLPLILTVASVAGSCAPQRSAQEETLRQSLILLRAEVSQFTLAHHRTPASMAELISSTYIKQLPTDPFTGRNDTWRIEKSADDFKIHSGSDAISAEGTPYSSW
jgi:general secretion pathway protein G